MKVVLWQSSLENTNAHIALASSEANFGCFTILDMNKENCSADVRCGDVATIFFMRSEQLNYCSVGGNSL